MKGWLIGIAVAVLLIALAAGGAMYGAWLFVETPYDDTGNATTIFTVETGDSWRNVSETLEKQGLVRWGEAFRLYSRLRKLPLQAGEFELSAAMSPRRILEILAHGKPILHRLSFAEGLTMREVALAVDATGLTSAERFLTACNDTQFLQAHGINATTAEGYLFPETYFFPRIPGHDPYPILEALLERFRETVATLPQSTDQQTLHRMVILASMVEKETAVGAERATIAGVYARRLELGMLMQCDPTVIYGLGDQFDGNLRRLHLQDPANPYNTYVHPGLPPGPICSPGKAALVAASRPESHAYLYFVARQDGTHQFSRTLGEHNDAVFKYQRHGRPMPTTQAAP